MSRAEKIVTVIIILMIGFFLFLYAQNFVYGVSKSDPLQLMIAKDKNSQLKGLSFLDHLEDNQGMLFEFDREENHCMWNADVKFPIVVLFMNTDKQFVGIASMDANERKPVCNVSRYALEVSPAWFKHNFDQGYQR